MNRRNFLKSAIGIIGSSLISHKFAYAKVGNNSKIFKTFKYTNDPNEIKYANFLNNTSGEKFNYIINLNLNGEISKISKLKTEVAKLFLILLSELKELNDEDKIKKIQFWFNRYNSK